MKWEFSEAGMYRVVIVINHRCNSHIMVDYDHCEKSGDVLTSTFWHRHDTVGLGNKLEAQANRIIEAYRNHPDYSGAVLKLEYKPYER